MGARGVARDAPPQPRGVSPGPAPPPVPRAQPQPNHPQKTPQMHQGPAGEGGWPGPDRPCTPLDGAWTRRPVRGREHEDRVPTGSTRAPEAGYAVGTPISPRERTRSGPLIPRWYLTCENVDGQL